MLERGRFGPLDYTTFSIGAVKKMPKIEFMGDDLGALIEVLRIFDANGKINSIRSECIMVCRKTERNKNNFPIQKIVIEVLGDE